MITKDQIAALHEAMITAANEGDEDAEETARFQLGDLAGTGTPANEAFAESLGIDYVCALEDGTIVAHGADIALPGRGRSIRDLVFIAPAQQQ